MAKKVRTRDPDERARRKLARAELKLREAQDRHERAAKRLVKAAEEVERRTERVARAEERLVAVTREADRTPAAPDASADPLHLEVPDASEWEPPGERLVEEPAIWGLAVEPLPDRPQPEIAVPLRDRELRALQVLQRQFNDNGLAVGEWRAATGMPETTFARARKALMLQGLVRADGEPGRHTRYVLTDGGKKALSE